jgi:hypothetical protein
MANTQGFADVFEEDGRLVVLCKIHVGKDKQLDLATAIANADAILQGKARVIYFQQPDGALFATARPGSGIKLK